MKYIPKSRVFLDIQSELSQRGLVRLFAFFAEVMVDQRLHYSTILHAIELVDFVVACQQVDRGSLLTLGAACLTLSCKLEEIYVSWLSHTFLP